MRSRDYRRTADPSPTAELPKKHLLGGDIMRNATAFEEGVAMCSSRCSTAVYPRLQIALIVVTERALSWCAAWVFLTKVRGGERRRLFSTFIERVGWKREQERERNSHRVGFDIPRRLSFTSRRCASSLHMEA